MEPEQAQALWRARLADDELVVSEGIRIAAIGDESVLPAFGYGVVIFVALQGGCTLAVAAADNPIDTARRCSPDVGWQWGWVPTRTARAASQVALDLNMRWPDPLPPRPQEATDPTNQQRQPEPGGPGMFAFFPWLTIEGPTQVAGFWLLPYRRGHVPCGAGTAAQQAMDTLAGCYMQSPEDCIENAVVLARDPRAPLRRLSEDDLQAAFELAQLVTVDALASRNFFDWPGGYVNGDQFRLVAQNFTEQVDGVTIIARRRDGGTRNFWPIELYQVWQPEHVSTTWRVTADGSLLAALVAAQGHPDWGRFFESVISFNLANTDSDAIAMQSEAVLLMSALERVLNARPKDNELLAKFSDLFRPSSSLAKSDCERIRSSPRQFNKTDSVSGVWLLDFFAFRGHLAHGRAAGTFRPVWSLREHLLLGSFIYPVLLKLSLAALNLYELVERDHVHVEAFERLASLDDVFHSERDERGVQSWAWRDTLGHEESRRRDERALEAYRQAITASIELGGDDGS